MRSGTVARALPVLAFALTITAALLDTAGRLSDGPGLWIIGAHMALAALSTGVVSLFVWVFAGVGRLRSTGVVAWFCGLALVASGRLLRGAAGVAPDRPLIAAVGLGGLLLLFGWWRRARAQRSAAISPSR